MARLKPAAFLSYVRFDDEHEDGRLSEFRKRLSGEVRVQTGEEFPIFQDRNDISWGQNWQRRIDEAIDHSTFLICILTPGFFKSFACRKEVDKFVQREKRLGRADLILAVYYVECLQLRDKKQIEKDKIAKLMFTRQYVDWRDLRFEPFTSAEAGKSLAQLASQIRDAMQRPSGKSRVKATPTSLRRLRRSAQPGLPPSANTKPEAITEVKESAEVPAPRTEPVTRIVDSTGRGQHTSISDAIAAADPGNRILIRPGVYREHLIVDKPLELIGDGKIDEIVLSDSTDDVVDFQTTIGRIANLTISQESKDEIALRNAIDISQGRLILENCHLLSAGGAVIFIRGGADPQIANNKITNLGGTQGIAVQAARGLIEKNEINVNNAFGIVVLSRGAAPIIRQNTIRSTLISIQLIEEATSTIDDNDMGSAWRGILASGNSTVVVTRNRIHDCTTGIRIEAGGRGTIEGNAFTGNSENAVEVESGAQATVMGNLFVENGGYGVTAPAGASVTLGGNDFRGNTKGDTSIEPKKTPK
jgi:parallel beta-helix repeat protein